MKSTKINAQWEEVEGLAGLYVRKAAFTNNTQELDQAKLQKIAKRKVELEEKVRDIRARRLSF